MFLNYDISNDSDRIITIHRIHSEKYHICPFINLAFKVKAFPFIR